jgi:hypothetical protein
VHELTLEFLGDPLQALPPEMLLRILSNIGYQDAIRLSQASHDYFSFVEPDKWPTEEKIAFRPVHKQIKQGGVSRLTCLEESDNLLAC